MLVSKIKEEDLTVQVIDRLLFEGLEDTGENADCIIVLGSIKASKYRVPVAVQAYNAGRSTKILLCGGKLRDFPDGKNSEAENMHQAALDLGVNEEDILCENTSMSTIENISFAMEKLAETIGLNNIHRLILVTTAYHMRRSLAIAQYIFPKHISIIPCPANDTNTKRDNWMHTPKGTERAKAEALKIINYINNGQISDIDV